VRTLVSLLVPAVAPRARRAPHARPFKRRDLRRLLARHQIRHLTTQPYRPRTNGKIERLHQTIARE
jgi:transposase InsO family protein